MKILTLIVILCPFIMSCSSSKDQEVQTESAVKTEEPRSLAELEDLQEIPDGLKLINNSDCNVCHRQNEKLIGPSYADIAKKYEKKDVEILTDRIIKGSNGVWGEVVMPGHPNLENADVKIMVSYILSLSKL